MRICCGANHNLAVDFLGKIYVWGSGKNGKLGFEDELYRASPVHLKALDHEFILDISASSSNSACISQSGRLYTWG